ncbi:MAG: hypothetical protein ACJAS2_001072 [Pseudohongiellaceae bacterium]|jgi:hypothetical protein
MRPTYVDVGFGWLALHPSLYLPLLNSSTVSISDAIERLPFLFEIHVQEKARGS